MGHKNDYTCITYFEHSKPKKWSYVHKLDGFIQFLNSKHKDWKYVNVYERRTRKYLTRIYPGMVVKPFLGLVFVALISSFLRSFRPLNSTFNNGSSFSGSPLYGLNNTTTTSTAFFVKKEGIL